MEIYKQKIEQLENKIQEKDILLHDQNTVILSQNNQVKYVESKYEKVYQNHQLILRRNGLLYIFKLDG
jgi:CMP-N-acetylneuraminic acid synthetase